MPRMVNMPFPAPLSSCPSARFFHVLQNSTSKSPSLEIFPVFSILNWSSALFCTFAMTLFWSPCSQPPYNMKQIISLISPKFPESFPTTQCFPTTQWLEVQESNRPRLYSSPKPYPTGALAASLTLSPTLSTWLCHILLLAVLQHMTLGLCAYCSPELQHSSPDLCKEGSLPIDLPSIILVAQEAFSHPIFESTLLPTLPQHSQHPALFFNPVLTATTFHIVSLLAYDFLFVSPPLKHKVPPA